MAAASGQNSTLLITLGIFLKMLGFFVVMVGYSTLEPVKSRQAEYSLQNQFGIHVTLPRMRGGKEVAAPIIAQGTGQSYDELGHELMTQMDFLGVENIATSDQLELTLPADILLPMNNHSAKSPRFAEQLGQILQAQHPANSIYNVIITVKNGEANVMMRSLGDFVQKMIAAGYPAKYLTIGYQQNAKAETSVSIIIKAVRV